MTLKTLTDTEIRFLGEQGIPIEKVYDARGQSRAEWRARVKELDSTLIIGAACQAAGHRLRTRSGHCVQCDTSKLAYSTTHSSEGTIYIAISESEGVLKVGCTLDRFDRERQLRSSGYGGIRDWTIIASACAKNMGAAEHQIAKALTEYRFEGRYEREGKSQQATEMYRVPLEEALRAFAAAAKSHKGRDFWKHPKIAKFS